MAWTTPKTWASGYVVLAADLNTHLRDNLNMTAPALVTTDGDIVVATAANALKRLNATGSGDTFIHEVGAWELDISALTTNDTVGGASAGVAEIKVPVTQAEAEGGTNTRFSLWSAARVKQAIQALAGIPVFSRVVLTSGSITTTSTTLVDVTGAILTMTTGAYPLMWTVAQCIQNSGANGQVFMNIEVNNTTLLLGTAGLTFHQHDTGGKRTIAGLSGMTAALSAQENILKLQWKVDGGTGTIFADSAISFMFAAAEVR